MVKHSQYLFREISEIGKKTKPPVWYFCCIEWIYGGEKETGLVIAVTDCTNAWISKVDGPAFDKLVASCRVGDAKDPLSNFVSHTNKSFSDDASNGAEEYVLDAQPGKDGNLVFKWKLKESGISLVIGQAELQKSTAPTKAITRIFEVANLCTLKAEKELDDLRKERDRIRQSIGLLQDLHKQPDVRPKLLKRCVEVINDAKAENRALGGTSEGFESAWIEATQADVSQSVNDDEMDG